MCAWKIGLRSSNLEIILEVRAMTADGERMKCMERGMGRERKGREKSYLDTNQIPI